jgi:urea transport system permease protein
MVGALLVSFLQSTLSDVFGSMWQLVLGVVLILIVYFLPKGIVGTLQDIQYNKRIAKVIEEVKAKQGA